MRIQVLVATMNQKDHALVRKMNIRTDAIISNQCDYNSIDAFNSGNNCVTYLNFHEKGVGLNRNNALMRATADICLFADDDIVYEDNYAEIVERVFIENPDADVILFNLKENVLAKKLITKKVRVGYLNYLRYGTPRVAVRLNSVKRCGIYFNQCFGGGTEYCHGEDSLFLNACLKNGLKIVAVPECIATIIDERPSSWNHGYDDKYICDQGVLYRALSRRWWRLLCFQDAFRRHKSYKKSCLQSYRMMCEGVKRKY